MNYTKEQFLEDCKVMKVTDEYPNYNGMEKHLIITKLNEEEFYERYESMLIDFVPFLLLSGKVTEVVIEYNAIEEEISNKKRRYELYYEEGVTERAFYGKYGHYVDEPSPYCGFNDLYTAIDKLTDTEKRRIIDHFIGGLSMREIARREGVNKNAVQKSVDQALKKLKKLLEQGGQNDTF